MITIFCCRCYRCGHEENTQDFHRECLECGFPWKIEETLHV